MERTMDNYRVPVNSLELAGRTIEKCYTSDGSAPSFIELTSIINNYTPTYSGFTDQDYPNLSGLALGLTNFTQIKTLSKVPLPPEVMEHFGRILFMIFFLLTLKNGNHAVLNR